MLERGEVDMCMAKKCAGPVGAIVGPGVGVLVGVNVGVTVGASVGICKHPNVTVNYIFQLDWSQALRKELNMHGSEAEYGHRP